MDFPVEATVHLNDFPDETQVQDILCSHGFHMRDLSRHQVRVKGSFLELKAAKAQLEPLLYARIKTDVTQPPSSRVPTASSGAIAKYYSRNSTDRTTGRSGSRNKPRSLSSPTTPSSSNHHPPYPDYSSSYSPRLEQRSSFRAAKESFLIDADVFDYAKKLRKRAIDDILESHNVDIEVCPVGDSYDVALCGKSAKTAVSKLQSLLMNLRESLRTQEVSLRDLDRDGRALLDNIQRNGDVHNSVLVCPKSDGLHLIGPSRESYELKQKLLEGQVDSSGRTGRTKDRSSRGRISSLPPANRRTDRDAVAYQSPAGAGGHNPSKYQDEKQKGGESRRGADVVRGVHRQRSYSETRQKNRTERTNGCVQDNESKHLPRQSPMKGRKQLLTFKPDNIKTMFKNMQKK